MKIFDLFEKQEQRQIDILLLTLKNRREITISELANQLYINKETVRDDIVRIQETLSPIADRFSVRYKNDHVSVISAGDVSNVEVYYQFLSKTISYQLLVELYRTNKIKKPIFAAKMSISLATLTRRIRQLNTILEFFDIQIRNGQLQGDEIQIRHFYFNLFWNGIPYEQIKEFVYTPERADFIQELEKKLDIPLEEWTQVRMALWMSVTRKRMSLKVDEPLDLPRSLNQICVSKALFEVLYESFAIFYSRYAYNFSLEEGKIFYLYFIVGFSIPLKSSWWEQILNDSAAEEDPIWLLNQHTIEVLEKDFHVEQVDPEFIRSIKPCLYQIHTRFLYFKGHIYHVDDQGNNSLGETFFETRLRSLCELLVKENQGLITRIGLEKNYDWEKLAEQYHLLLYDIYCNLTTELKIAFEFPTDHSFTVMLKEKIISQIDTRVSFKIVEPGGKVKPDILITSLRRDYYQIPKNRVYVVLNVEYDYDMAQVLTFITDAYKEKVMKEVMK